ncbi:MAG: hypothetical protein ACLTK8_00810 [Paeniclostridium sp.]
MNTSMLEKLKKNKNGDEYTKLIYDAIALQIAKSIGELATIVNGDVDAIIITGGIAYSKYDREHKNRVKFIAHVEILPGKRIRSSCVWRT